LPDVTQASVISGVASTLILAVITVMRQKRVDTIDIGSFMAAFFSGTNLPPALFLFLYVFAQDPLIEQSKLKGYEKYISAAGLVLFLASAIAIWKLCKTAWEVSKEATAEESLETIPVTAQPARAKSRRR
jgi:hypothetical protein